MSKLEEPYLDSRDLDGFIKELYFLKLHWLIKNLKKLKYCQKKFFFLTSYVFNKKINNFKN